MTKTANAFINGKALIPIITAGDPNLATTKQLIIGMVESGADLIQIGIPFSDPVAESPIVQRANERALTAGTTTDKIFDMMLQVRHALPKFPLALATYINPIYVYGYEKFFSKCQQLGIDAIIVPDVPFEEKEELLPCCQKHGVDLISFISPSSKNRMGMIVSQANGFLYCIVPPGTSDIENMLGDIRKTSAIPIIIAADGSTPKQICSLAKYADGITTSNTIAELCEQYNENCIEHIKKHVRQMKDSLTNA